MPFLLKTLSIALVTLFASSSLAQNYPSRVIQLVTSEVGGSSDFGARLIARGLTPSLGQRVIVENRPAGVIPVNTVVRAAPDGHVLLFYSNPLWTTPLLQSVPYDPVKDLAPVTLAYRAPNILVVHPSVPANSVEALIALAKAKPGVLNYGSSSSGSANHLAAELFKFMAGVNIVRIPYKGVGPYLQALLAGEIHFAFASGGTVASHIRSGKMRALAVASAQPSALTPDLPTVAASGLSGFVSEVISGVFAPTKTPTAVVNHLNTEIVRFLTKPETKEFFLRAGAEVIGSSPEEFAATIQSEVTRMAKVIKAADIRVD